MPHCGLKEATYTVRESSAKSNNPKEGDQLVMSLSGTEADPRFELAGPDLSVQGRVVKVFGGCKGQVLVGVAEDKVAKHSHYVVLFSSDASWKHLYMEFLNIHGPHEHKDFDALTTHNGQVHLET